MIGIDGLGNGALVNYNKAGTPLAGITTANASNGGYIFANLANGKDVARMTSLTDGSGYISADNNAGKTVSYVTANTVSGGYVGVANSGGNDRARITTNANGAGHISASNANGNNVVQMSVSNANHGEIATSNAAGAIINSIGATGLAHGYIAANYSSGLERSFVTVGTNGGEIGVNDNSGKNRVLIGGGGFVEVKDVDGSYLQLYSSGSSANLILVDKFQHPRAEVKSGTILAKGPNGKEHSFMSSATAPNLGYIGVCNSNLPGSPVKAGMYTTANNQGVFLNGAAVTAAGALLISGQSSLVMEAATLEAGGFPPLTAALDTVLAGTTLEAIAHIALMSVFIGFVMSPGKRGQVHYPTPSGSVRSAGNIKR